MKRELLQPFGLTLVFDEPTKWDDLDLGEIRASIDTHAVVVLRGISPMEPQVLAAAARKLGPLQPWPFGAVHEIKRVVDTENYLYTEHGVPLHWDGAFADAVPHYLVFRCVAAPPASAGGETVFVDTRRVLENASDSQRERWRVATVRYSTERKAHYGGTFTSPIIARHPALGVPMIRYAEPVEDLNPVSVRPVGLGDKESATLMDELRDALHQPNSELALPWREDDVVIADNHALLHGRRAFLADAPRHLLRVNVLDPERRWWFGLRDSWRIRRPEFMRAEIPILFIPAFLSATRLADFASVGFWEGAAVFWLLFQSGDMVNCLLDRDVDLHRKTHLSEAVRALGATNVKVQIGITAAIAIALGVHLALTLARPWMAVAALLGIALGASYTAPPLRLKNRGLVQLAAYVGLLFVGPMAMIAGLFGPFPTPAVVLVSIAYGALQSGVLLVNTAEDLDEDEREGTRTVAVALQAGGTMRLGRALAGLAGISLIAILGSLCRTAWWALALLPLLGVVFYNERWLARLTRSTRGIAEARARTAIRAQGKYVPRHLEAGAWAALLGAIAVFASRLW